MRRLAFLALAMLALAPAAQAAPPDPMEIQAQAPDEATPEIAPAVPALEVGDAVLQLARGEVPDLVEVAVATHVEAVARIEAVPICSLDPGLALIEPDGVAVPIPDQSSPPAPGPDRLNEPDRLTAIGDIHITPATPAEEVRAPTRPAA